MNGNVRDSLDYLAHLGPPAIIIDVFPRSETGGHGFLSFTAKEYHQMVKR